MSMPIFVKRIGYSDIYNSSEDSPTYFNKSGMQIDADGSPRAYHPQPGLGLDNLANAGRPGNWWGIVTDENGNPVVQGKADPAEGYYVSTTSLQDKRKNITDPNRYVNSELIPYFVLPQDIGIPVGLGDLGYAVNTVSKKSSGCIFADFCPPGMIGEGSIALADAIGVPSNPKTGGVACGIMYFVFTGSSRGWPRDINDIRGNSQSLLDSLGGVDRLRSELI